MIDKVKEWSNEIATVILVPMLNHAHAVYAAFKHEMIIKWSYLSRTILNIDLLHTGTVSEGHNTHITL